MSKKYGTRSGITLRGFCGDPIATTIVKNERYEVFLWPVAIPSNMRQAWTRPATSALVITEAALRAILTDGSPHAGRLSFVPGKGESIAKRFSKRPTA